jgi:hypothetical protein
MGSGKSSVHFENSRFVVIITLPFSFRADKAWNRSSDWLFVKDT